MKNLTKILLMLSMGISMLGLYSCISDPPAAMERSNTHYTYINRSSRSIRLDISSTNEATNRHSGQIVYIQRGAQVTIYYKTRYYKHPLCLIEENPEGSVNSVKIYDNGGAGLIMEQSSRDGSLYDINNYKFDEKLSDNIYGNTYYEFTFTDEFFGFTPPAEE